MPFPGSAFILKLEDPNNLGSFITVGGGRSCSFSISGSAQSTKDFIGQTSEIVIPGTKQTSLTISSSGLFVNSDAEQTVFNLKFSGEAWRFKLCFANQKELVANFYVTAFSRSGDMSAPEGYSLSLLGHNVTEDDIFDVIAFSASYSRSSTAFGLDYSLLAENQPITTQITSSPGAFLEYQPLATPYDNGSAGVAYDAMITQLKNFATANPTTVQYFNLCAVSGGQALPSTREMAALTYNNRDNLPVFIIHTAVHGNENWSVPVTLNFLETIISSSDPLLTWVRNNITIVWLATPNPDGYYHNKRRNLDTANTALGVNINRNYPWFFHYAADPDKSTTPSDPDSFLDQIESQNIVNWTYSFLARTKLCVDIHGWTSKDFYGFLTDNLWLKGTDAHQAQRNCYLYMMDLIEKRDWSAFTKIKAINDPQPFLDERRSSRKPYFPYWVHSNMADGGFAFQFEYCMSETPGLSMTMILDILTASVMSMRDSIGGTVKTAALAAPAVAVGDIVNSNSHLTSWNSTEQRPTYFSRTGVTAAAYVTGSEASSSIETYRPAEAAWPILIADAGYCSTATASQTGRAIVAGGYLTDMSSPTNKGYAEDLEPETPPAIGSSPTSVYTTSFVQTTYPNLPISIKDNALASDGTYIYSAFGFDSSSAYRKEIYRIAVDGSGAWSLWKTSTHYANGLQRHTLNYWHDGTEGWLIVAGGQVTGGTYTSDVVKIRISDGTETKIGDITSSGSPEGRGRHCATIYNNKLYVFGGWNGTSRRTSILKMTLPTGGNMTLVTTFSSGLRDHCGAQCNLSDPAKNYFYMFGGDRTDVGNNPSVFRFDLDAETLSTITPTLDSDEDEDGNVTTIDPFYKLRSACIWNGVTKQFMLVGGQDGVTLLPTSSVYLYNESTTDMTVRAANDARWGYLRPTTAFTSSSGEKYSWNVVLQNVSPDSELLSAYVRPTVYLGPWGSQRTIRFPYTVPPKGDGYITMSLPFDIHSGAENELRAYLRHYAGGSALRIAAMQLVKTNTCPVVVPGTGKSKDTVTLAFSPVFASAAVSATAKGVFTPCWGSQQLSSVTAIAFTCTGGYDITALNLKWVGSTAANSATGLWDDLDVITGKFVIERTISGVTTTTDIEGLRLNHDRRAPKWQRDAVHWRLRLEYGVLTFDLWFYNRLVSTLIGEHTFNITAAVMDGNGVAHAVT